MPGAHRENDRRYCGASTEVVGQSTVYVNSRLWAVDGDPATGHGGGGFLKPVYGPPTVYIENKKIICAVGDTAYNPDNLRHDPGPVDPLTHSYDVGVYGGKAGGG